MRLTDATSGQSNWFLSLAFDLIMIIIHLKLLNKYNISIILKVYNSKSIIHFCFDNILQ